MQRIDACNAYDWRWQGINAQFKKGVLELTVLALLSRKDRYGFELVNRISRSIDISEGTMYPLLKRLRDDGLLSTYLMESSEGPPRKYYQLTDGGRRRYQDMRKEWDRFVRGVEQLLGIDEDIAQGESQNSPKA